MLAVLAKREINEVMVEAGAVLNGALLRSQLIDEMIFYVAPKLMGDSARAVFSSARDGTHGTEYSTEHY